MTNDEKRQKQITDNYYRTIAEYEKARQESNRNELSRIFSISLSAAALAISIISIVMRLLG